MRIHRILIDIFKFAAFLCFYLVSLLLVTYFAKVNQSILGIICGVVFLFPAFIISEKFDNFLDCLNQLKSKHFGIKLYLVGMIFTLAWSYNWMSFYWFRTMIYEVLHVIYYFFGVLIIL